MYISSSFSRARNRPTTYKAARVPLRRIKHNALSGVGVRMGLRQFGCSLEEGALDIDDCYVKGDRQTGTVD
jgi:hypothetical protein